MSAIGWSPVARRWREAGGARRSGPGPSRAGHAPVPAGGRVHRARGHRLAVPPSQPNGALCSPDRDGVCSVWRSAGSGRRLAGPRGRGRGYGGSRCRRTGGPARPAVAPLT